MLNSIDAVDGASTSAGRQRPPKWMLWVAGLGLAGLSAIALPSPFPMPAGKAEATHPPAPALTVDTATAAVADWPLLLEATGSVEAWQEASIAAPATGLRLVTLAANVGDKVHEGQTLAQFDTAMLLAERSQLAAEVAQARALLAEADANKRRAVTLKASGTVSDKALLEAGTHAAASLAQLASAEARLAANQLQIQRATVTAPAAGTISLRAGRLGAVSDAGTELFRLIIDDRLEWRGQLTAAQVRDAALGQPVDLALPDGTTASGRIRQLSSGFSADTRLLTAYVDIAPGGHARPGMYAAGRIRRGRSAAVTVPAASVVVRDGRSYVFGIAGPNEVTPVALRPVVTGRQRDQRIEIREGIEAGDRVVALGAGFLNDGDLVRLSLAAGKETAP